MPDHSFSQLLIALVAVLATAKLLGVIAQRFNQPAVVGELIAGVLLGASVFGIVDPNEPVIHALAEIGVLVLLFEIGLHTDLKSLVKVGNSAVVVAIIGLVLPFGLGYWVATGALTSELYSALALMVLVTTFMTPPLLAWRIGVSPSKIPHQDPPGEGGIDDLVSGAAQDRHEMKLKEHA